MSDQVFWFATRSAGILSWFAATLSLGVGLLMSSRALGRRPTVPWLLDVHRYLAAMSIVFLGLHLATLWLDSFVTLSLADFVIPGRAVVPGLGRLSLAWGVLAAWILLLVEASSLIKNYLPPEFWHTLHLSSFGVVILGLVHALQAGSDADNRVMVALAVSVLTGVLLVGGIRALRVLGARKERYNLTLADGPEPEVDDDESMLVTAAAAPASEESSGTYEGIYDVGDDGWHRYGWAGRDDVGDDDEISLAEEHVDPRLPPVDERGPRRPRPERGDGPRRPPVDERGPRRPRPERGDGPRRPPVDERGPRRPPAERGDGPRRPPVERDRGPRPQRPSAEPRSRYTPSAPAERGEPRSRRGPGPRSATPPSNFETPPPVDEQPTPGSLAASWSGETEPAPRRPGEAERDARDYDAWDDREA